MIKKLDVTCENKESGCGWRDKLQYYEVKIIFKIDHHFLILIVHIFKVVGIQT